MIQPKRILLIDDNDFIVTLYKDVLETAGFEVIAEKSSMLALNRILNHEPFDLIITDIVMTQLDGWELLSTVREGLKIDEYELPIIVMSSYDSIDIEFKSLKLKANAWFVKPIKPLSKLVTAAKTLTGTPTDGGFVKNE